MLIVELMSDYSADTQRKILMNAFDYISILCVCACLQNNFQKLPSRITHHLWLPLKPILKYHEYFVHGRTFKNPPRSPGYWHSLLTAFGTVSFHGIVNIEGTGAYVG